MLNRWDLNTQQLLQKSAVYNFRNINILRILSMFRVEVVH